MRDLIDRQAAIAALSEAGLINYAATGDGNGMIQAVNVIKGLPSAQPEQRWIQCSERLPAVHESGNSFSGIYMQSYPVLVYGASEYDDKYRSHIATYCDDLNGNTYWSTEVDTETVNGVTAWMPLPEPYREKGECDV